MSNGELDGRQPTPPSGEEQELAGVSGALLEVGLDPSPIFDKKRWEIARSKGAFKGGWLALVDANLQAHFNRIGPTQDEIWQKAQK